MKAKNSGDNFLDRNIGIEEKDFDLERLTIGIMIQVLSFMATHSDV